MGYIEHSKSPSPIVMVKRKTGKWRLFVDFRQINAKSINDAYPTPRINYIVVCKNPDRKLVWTTEI